MDEMRRLIDKYSDIRVDSRGGHQVERAKEPSVRPDPHVETNMEGKNRAPAQGLTPKAVLQECSGNLR